MLSIGRDIKLTNFRVFHRFAYRFEGDLYFDRLDYFKDPCVYAVVVVVSINDMYVWKDFEFDREKGRLAIRMRELNINYYHDGSIYLLTRSNGKFGGWEWYDDINQFINNNVYMFGDQRVILVWKDESLEEKEELNSFKIKPADLRIVCTDDLNVMTSDCLSQTYSQVANFMREHNLLDPPRLDITDEGRVIATWDDLINSFPNEWLN